MKKLLSLALTLILALSCIGCSNEAIQDQNSTDTGKTKLKIGILQLAEHPALDQAKEGFVKALADAGFVDGETVEIDYQNAQNDPSNLLTISQRFSSNKSDLILAIATGAAQSAASQTKDIPILFTAVTDPVTAGLVNSIEAPGGNISGTTDMSPIKDQIELLLELAPNTKTVGILYNSSEDNSAVQAQVLKEILAEKGLGFVQQTVTSSNDVQQATQSIIEKCDAIYIPTDNTFASAMPIVADITHTAKIPVICAEEGPVKNGGLATVGLNYFNLGYQTGEMAVLVLNGEEVSKLSVEALKNFNCYINSQTAEAIGIEIPEHLTEFAK